MPDKKNKAAEDQAERDKASGDKGGAGEKVDGGLTKEEKGDQRGGGADAGGDDGED